MARKLDASVAFCLRPVESRDLDRIEDDYFLWTGWKKHHWPGDVLVPGFRFYGFDREKRRLSVLLEVSKGGAFRYRTKRALKREVERLTGWVPDEDDTYWDRAPTASADEPPCHGIAIRWKKIRKVDIPLAGSFPRLGWRKLDGFAEATPMDFADQYEEGARVLRSHRAVERNRALRERARQYWETRLGSLRCQACGFDFARTYGDRGAGFVELHHQRPVAKGTRKSTVEDLVPLCSNCHRMVHRIPERALPVEELQRSIRRARRQPK